MGRECLLDKCGPAIIEHIASGTTITNACALVGISQGTYFSWMRFGKAGDKRFHQFFLDAEQAKAIARLRLEHVIVQAAPDDWRAAAWMLERQHPEEYAQRSEVRTIHELPTPEHLQGLGAETLEARIREIDAKQLTEGGTNGQE